MRKPSSRKVKSAPYSHKEMARAIFNYEINRHSLSTWLKIEAYTLFFTVLPHLITFAVWLAIAAAFYWGVTLIQLRPIHFQLTPAPVSPMGVFISITGNPFMPLEINPQTRITMLDPDFVSVVNDLLKDTTLEASEVIALNFRDPTYSAGKGGYHPVEIHVDSSGVLQCLTDFAYFGMPPMVELGIELDWSFIEHGYFRQFDSMYDLECGRSLLGLYLANFTAYYQSGVYQVEVTTL